MVKDVLYILLILTFISCQESNPGSKFMQLLDTWSGKEIIFPNELMFSIQGRDTIDIRDWEANYKIVSYIDSSGCTVCKLNLKKWNAFIDSARVVSNHSIVPYLYFHPQSSKEIMYLLRRDNFKYPVCIDNNDTFNKLNKLPSNEVFQTFLLDKDNKIVLIGNPILNPKVKELYLSVLQGKLDLRSKQLKTTAVLSNNRIDLGTLHSHEECCVEIELKNTGDNPLIIKDVIASCSCITVRHSKNFILPGDNSLIILKYKAEHPGRFYRTVDIFCNIEDSPLEVELEGDAI